MTSRVLTDWNPEDPVFWQRQGRRIAIRNLCISIPALLLAFAIWMVWSVVIVNLPHIGFRFTTNQLFWLASVPGISGATLRIFYSFMVPIFGGRLWTALSTASLAIPALWMGIAVQDPSTSYVTFLVIALLCGFGGGNFASSMANISFFFPKSLQGTALGLNAGLGNLGVSVAQFVVPLVITTAVFGALGGGPQTWIKGDETKLIWLQNAGFIWVPFILATVIAAWFGMNDIASARASFAEQSVIFRRKHNWLMCWLYLGTFGSFIGYSAGFPMLIKTQFAGVDPLQYAYLGPLVGALSRPLGGWIADKVSGARVTFWNFIIMTIAGLGVLVFLPKGSANAFALPWGPAEGSFAGFFTMFMLLFFTSGIGNGSTFRMIPVIFRTLHERWSAGQEEQAKAQAMRNASKEAAAVLGFTSAVAAYGAFFIPKSYGTSIDLTGGAEAALWLFILFYLTCIAVTWRFYSRKNAEIPC